MDHPIPCFPFTESLARDKSFNQTHYTLVNWHSNGNTPFSIGNISTIRGFSIAMLVYRSVIIISSVHLLIIFQKTKMEWIKASIGDVQNDQNHHLTCRKELGTVAQGRKNGPGWHQTGLDLIEKLVPWRRVIRFGRPRGFREGTWMSQEVSKWLVSGI